MFSNVIIEFNYYYIYCYSADAQYSTSTINTNVIIKSNGEVTWLSHGIYSSSCDMNVEYFPFDIQSCKMKWSSWTYDGFQVLSFIFFTQFYILHLIYSAMQKYLILISSCYLFISFSAHKFVCYL